MTQEKVDMYLMQKGKYFPEGSVYMVRDKLLAMDDKDFPIVNSLEFLDPTTNLIVSVLAGSFGIDRFMIGDTGMGVLKLLTGGLCGILTIIDWFNIQKLTRAKNLEKFMNYYRF